MAFNPNELVLEKITTVEEYVAGTNDLVARYTQIEDGSLQTSADGTDVTDARGTTIMTFYNAQTGTFSFSNSVFSLDLAASQFGTEKIIAGDTKIKVPVSEILTIGEDHTATLSYTPVGTKGSEISSVTVISNNNTLGEKYVLGSTSGDDKFTLDTTTKKITLPEKATGKVFVNYTRESTSAAQVDKSTDTSPKTRRLLITAIFHPVCDKNICYVGYISCPRAEIDPSSVEITLTPDGKHAASYKLQKDYCDDDAKLFTIIVPED